MKGETNPKKGVVKKGIASFFAAIATFFSDFVTFFLSIIAAPYIFI